MAGAGLVVLLLSGDVLVRGAVSLSLRLGVPALMVSLTVVAFGTSAPELLVAIQAALEGVPEIALGNVVGSNIANVLLVMGIPAVLSRIDPRNCDTRRNFVFMLAVSLLFIVLCFLGPLHFWHALVLLAVLTMMLVDAAHSAHRARCDSLASEVRIDEVDLKMPGWRAGLYILLGIIGLPVGAEILVDGSVGIARAWGVSNETIGLTLIAVGTSLPELATSVMAAIRRQADVILGNVIGSNLFNILAIMGVTSLFGPLPVSADFLGFHLWAMLASSLLLLPFVWGLWRLGRRWGIVFVAIYGFYVSFIVA
ncbi:MAG: calcium/sodium antiporter [Paracoccaceae bacterium]